MLFKLSDQELFETYGRAVQLKLDKEFIFMLKDEIKRRRFNGQEKTNARKYEDGEGELKCKN